MPADEVQYELHQLADNNLSIYTHSVVSIINLCILNKFKSGTTIDT